MESGLRLVPSSKTFSDSSMKSVLLITTLLIIPGLFAPAANAEQEKAFVEKYKTALEANDSATLQSVLYTTGADPDDCWLLQNDAVEWSGRQGFQNRAGRSDARRRKKATAPQDSPSGGKVCLNLKPTKKLVIVIEKKDENGSSTNTTENFISEKDGKFVIPVPGPCK
jgi:hypothetical protein